MGFEVALFFSLFFSFNVKFIFIDISLYFFYTVWFDVFIFLWIVYRIYLSGLSNKFIYQRLNFIFLYYLMFMYSTFYDILYFVFPLQYFFSRVIMCLHLLCHLKLLVFHLRFLERYELLFLFCSFILLFRSLWVIGGQDFT